MPVLSGAKRGRVVEVPGGEISIQSGSLPKEPSRRTGVTQILVPLSRRRRMNVTHLPSHDQLGDSSSPCLSCRSLVTVPVAGSSAHMPAVVGVHSPRTRVPSGNQSLARLYSFMDCRNLGVPPRSEER